MADFTTWTRVFLFSCILLGYISDKYRTFIPYVTGVLLDPPTARVYQSPIQPIVFQEESFVFVPGSTPDTAARWTNRYRCDDFDVTIYVNDTTLDLGIQLTPNSVITDATCYIAPVDTSHHDYAEFNVSNDDVVAYDVIAYNETCSELNPNETTTTAIAGEIICNITKYKNAVYSTTYMFNTSDVFLIQKSECMQSDGVVSYVSSCPADPPVSCSENYLSMFRHYPDGEIISYVSNSLEIEAKLEGLDHCGANIFYTWRVLRMEPNPNPHSGFNQQMSNRIHFPAQTFEPGTYLVILELETFENATIGQSVVFGDANIGDANYTYDEDYIKVTIMLPELIAHINGASVITYPYGETITLDGSASYDPVTMVTNDTSDELTTQWTMFSFDNSSISISNFTECVSFQFPNCTLLDFDPPYLTEHDVSNHSNVLTFNTSGMVDSMVMVIFTLSRGNRISSAVQGFLVKPRTPKLTLRCLYNCRTTRLNKISNDRLELFVSIDWGGRTDITGITYEWTASCWNASTGRCSDVAIQSDNGVNSPRIHINKGSLEEGGTYVISFSVNVTSETDGDDSHILHYVRTVNYRPYNGTCKSNKLAGVATVATFNIHCYGWMDEGDRLGRDSDLDTRPILTYIVVQSTPGAAVENEILLVSSVGNMTIPLKEGDPATNYSTLLQVKVTDIYGDFELVEFVIESVPAIDMLAITADRTGANVVSSIMAEVNSTLAQKVTSSPDVVLAYASSISSQLQTIPIPVRPAAVAKTLDSEPGVIMDVDIYEPLDEDTTGFQEYMTTSLNTTVDPATWEIQKAFEQITQYVSYVIYMRVVSGQKSKDQNYLTRVTQCLTNMIYVREYTTTQTKDARVRWVIRNYTGHNSNKPIFSWLYPIMGMRTLQNLVVNGLAILTLYSGNLWQIDVDATAEKEAGENELVSMTSQTVTAVVPNELNQARLVYGMEGARRSMDDMIVLTGGNISAVIDNAEMSPNERAYLYLKVQQQLQLELETTKPLAESSANSILDVTRQILASTELCESCTKQVGTGNYFQTLVRDNATTLASRPLTSGGTSVKLDSLANQSDQVVTASVIHFDKNIFMYDEDSASSQVAYGVIHVDIAHQNLTQDLVTYEQIVQNVEMELITPIVFEEDVSQFSLHKFIYRSGNDDICMTIEPLDDSVAEYNVYINKRHPPTVLVHDIHVTVMATSDWTVCVRASQMGGHTGMVHLGIQSAEYRLNNSSSTRTRRDVVSDGYPSYYFSLVTAACMNWEENMKAWNTNKCSLQWLPKETKIRCECRNIHDLTFGNSFFLAPNAIEFSTVFLRFSPHDQAAVIATMVAVFVLYALAVVWARRQDNKDIIRWGVTSLADNLPADDCYYIVKVHTGFRVSSGTDSRVAFILSGDKRDTGVRELHDDLRKRIPTGSIMQFLLSTCGHLGRLTHLRIWHDNSGEGGLASWYLSKVEIIDIQLHQSYVFICERWISVEDAGDSLECLLSAAGHQDLHSLDYKFANKAKNRLAEGHIWASIIYRPSFSNFTRVQRVTCAFMYVMVTMLANAMYYNPDDDYETIAEFKIGPFRFSLKQILVSVVCAVITTPSTLVAVMVFKHSRRRVNDIQLVERDKETIDPAKGKHHFSSWLGPQKQIHDDKSIDVHIEDMDSPTIKYSDSGNGNTETQLTIVSLDINQAEGVSQTVVEDMREDKHDEMKLYTEERAGLEGNIKSIVPIETASEDMHYLNNIISTKSDQVHVSNVQCGSTHVQDNDSKHVNHDIVNDDVEMVLECNEHNPSANIIIKDIKDENTQRECTGSISQVTVNDIDQTVTDIESRDFHGIDITNTDLQSNYTQDNLTRLGEIKMPGDGIVMQIGATDIKHHLPYWCFYIGWIIVWSSIIASGWFVLLYSVEWGKQKSEEWLSTFCMTLLESAIVVDPVMILLIAFGMAIVFKTIEGENVKGKYTTVVDKYERAQDERLEFGSFTTSPKPPLKEEDLQEGKRKRDTEVRWRKTLVDLVVNIFFLWVLVSISYSNRNDNSYYVHQAIGNRVMIINRNTTFRNISSTAAFYRWVNFTALPAIFPDHDSNGASIHWSLREYMAGFTNYRLGPPRLRQLRRKPEPCHIPKIKTDQCYRQYSVFSEESSDYCVGWRTPPCPIGESLYNHSFAAWKYTPADVTTGFPTVGHVATYSAGGYIATLDVNYNISLDVAKELYSSVWVDRKTRAVILEFTVFNPNVNLFSYNMFMVEFPETGGAFSSFSIMPLRVYQHAGVLGSYIFACEIFSICYLIILLFQIAIGVYTFRCKFYREFWFMFDCVRFCTAISALALYVVRLYSATIAIKAFNDNKRNFVDFHPIAVWDQLFVTVLALLVFMSVIRVLKTLEGNKNVYIIAKVFSLVASDLLWLGILLVYVFLLFAVLGFSLFGSRLVYFMNVYKSVTTLFITLIGKNRFMEVSKTDPIMAKLFLFIFSLTISFIIFSIFLSSLCMCIQEMTTTKSKDVDDVFLYAFGKLVRFCKRTPKTNSRKSNIISPIPDNISKSTMDID